MEARRNHAAGLLFWTRAPVGSSPTSTGSEDAWEDEDEEQAEKMREDHFVSQMDENGIIGLPEGLEDVQLEETYGGLKVSSGDEMVKHRTEHLLEGDKCVEKKEEKKKHQLTRRLGDLRAMTTLVEGHNNKRENDIRSTRSCGSHLPGVEPSGTSKHHCLELQSSPTVTASVWPPRFHFTAEELATARGIDAESFPEMSFSERFPESHCSHSSCKSSPRGPEISPQSSPQPVASFSDQVISNRYSSSGNGPTEGSRKSEKHHTHPASSSGGANKHSPRASSLRSCSLTAVENKASDKELRTLKAGNDGAKMDQSRKGYPSYHTPDFSKVEPRVHFPRSVYKPPKSKHSLTRKSFSPEPPLVFKSPADIVKEVLLNNTDGSSNLPDCNRPTTSTTNSTVPLEFRCRQQATTLLEQLQEDYNRLLTKYAEAENTIDRLRLEAKVNLYSDPPKAGQLVHSGLNRNSSGVLKLDFPQAQRTETSSTSPNGLSAQQGVCPSTGNPDLQLGQQLANILFDQTDMFLQQLQTFEDLLKSEKLKSVEKIKGLVQLTEGLNSLERGYLLARDEHKVLQQRGAETCHFDPERELEGLIFQCGVRMEDLKEQVEQLPLEPTCEASSSPTLQPTSSFDSSEGGECLIQPQNPTVPLLVHPGEAAKVAENGNEEEAQDKENLSSLYLTSQITSVPDLLNEPQSKSVPHSATLKSDMQCVAGDQEQEAQDVDDNVRKTPSPRKVESRHWDPPFDTSKCRHTRASPPLCSQSTMLPVLLPHSRRKFESHSSSLSSLADMTALQKRNSKGEMGSKTVLSQDGIISPETDSGFVGSETSHLIPAAAPSLLQQGSSESVSVFQDGKPRTSETGTTAASPPPRMSFRHVVQEHTVDSPTSQKHRRRRQEQSRCTLSCSPHRWMSQRELNSIDSGTSEFGLESDRTHTGSEVEHSDQYTQSDNSLHSSHSSSSPAALCHHGNSLRARRSSQVANYNDAMQMLQAEVTKLKERLESCLRHEKPLSIVTTAPVHKNRCHSNTSTPHRIRSAKQRSDGNQARRETQAADEVKDCFPSRETTRERLASAQRQKPQHDILRRSEVDFSTAQSQSTMSRCTQTCATPDPTPVLSKGTQTRQRPASVTADVPGTRNGGPHCLHCLSTLKGHAERPVGVSREPTRSSSCRHCCPAADCHQQEAVQTPGGAASSRYLADAVPPAVLQCTPVCTPQLLLYSGLVHVSPNKIPDASSRVRGSDERTGRTRRSLSAEKHRCLDSSLSRAIKAARHMKHTSRHMARSLATGLQDQELLAQSCSN